MSELTNARAPHIFDDGPELIYNSVVEDLGIPGLDDPDDGAGEVLVGEVVEPE